MSDQLHQRQEEEYFSIIEPLGDSASVCGYCHSGSDSSHAYGLWAHNLSPKVMSHPCNRHVYQLLMDRGWRRSGSYLYLPDRRSSCCPPYTIRCSASDFQPSRSQRQAAYRWRKFILNPQEKNLNHHKTPSKFDLCQLFDFSDLPHQDPISNTTRHSFKIRLEPAEFTQEKFELYKKYQTEVHGDRAEEVTSKSFERFLCTNPFRSDDSVAKHACWLVDDKMIAFSVVDILPRGISSVYLVWDTNYAKHGLGRLASLREIAWIQEWKDTLQFSHQFNWYYLDDAGLEAARELYSKP
ncbi:arginyl-tRNA--protein transferase 1 [Puccinia sorghi]|uniref:arginyltransferase n=1 Tax=Puccinia sorghi TaxID=27349 RepID=A0A0L6V766_9BASI|nr:arginyl-tRNA--protein transferase 1 [Puccinia sorghi]